MFERFLPWGAANVAPLSQLLTVAPLSQFLAVTAGANACRE